MITKRSEAQTIIDQYKLLLEKDVLNKPCILTFGSHTYKNIIVSNIELSKTTGMVNAPKKRMDMEGKSRTPVLFQLNTDEGILYFVLDDTIVTPLHNGIRFRIKQNKGKDLDVDIRRME